MSDYENLSRPGQPLEPGDEYRETRNGVLVAAGQWAPRIDVGPASLHRSEFAMHLLTAVENDIWIALVDEAEQTAPASRTDAQKAILRAWRHFTLAEYIHRTAPETQGGVYLLYLSGVFGLPFDGDGTPTEDQIAAIARHGRVAAFLLPE